MSFAHAIEIEETNTGGTMPATARKENGFDFEIVRNDAIPMPQGNPEGKIVDPQGNTVAPASHGIMARLNEKSKDEFTITKGMAAIIAILLTAAGLFLGYIVPTIQNGARESEKVVGIERDVQETRQDMKELKSQFNDIQKALNDQAVRDAEDKGKAFGYDVGRSDKNKGH
jgi:hypothetical protein